MSDRDDCAKMKPMLDAYYDGELAQHERADVDGHLSGCEACRKEVADIDRVSVSLRNLPKLQAPRDFSMDIDKVIHEKSKVVAFRKPLIWSSGAIAAALLVAFGMRFAGGGVNHAPVNIARTSQVPAVEVAQLPSQENSTKSGPVEQASNSIKSASATQHSAKTTQEEKQHAGKVIKPRIEVAENQSASAAKHEMQPALVAEKPQTTSPANQPTAQSASQTGAHEYIAFESVPSTAEEIGMSTDEDGLYALKL